MPNFKFIRPALVAVPLALMAQPALAQDGSISVQAEVLENCTVVSTPMNFGAITDVGATNVDTTATLTLVCTANAGYEVALDDGLNDNGGQRRLANLDGDEFINYDIYQNSSRSTRWGEELGADTVTGTASVLGTASLTAYGRIPQGVSKVSAGVYSDTVTVTVHF